MFVDVLQFQIILSVILCTGIMLVEHTMVERIEVENLIKYFISLEKKRHRRKMVVHPDPRTLSNSSV